VREKVASIENTVVPSYRTRGDPLSVFQPAHFHRIPMVYATLMTTLILASFARSLAVKVWSKDYGSGYARVHRISALTKTFFNFSGAAILFSLVSSHSFFTGRIVITELLNPVLLSLGFLMGGCLAAGWSCFFIGNEASIASSIFQNTTILALTILLPGAEWLLGINDNTGTYSHLGLILIVGCLYCLWRTNRSMEIRDRQISELDDEQNNSSGMFKAGAAWMCLSGIVISGYPIGIRYGLQVQRLDKTLLMSTILNTAAMIIFVIGRRRGEFVHVIGVIRKHRIIFLVLGMMTFVIFQAEAVLFALSFSVALGVVAKRGSCILDMVAGVVFFGERQGDDRLRFVAHGLIAAALVITGILLAFQQI
jgi:hypothetical protein